MIWMDLERETPWQNGGCPMSLLAKEEVGSLSPLSSISFSRAHHDSRPTSVQPRPIPPTPRKMMSNDTGVPCHTMYSREHRPNSSIPRPTSGTSRRATPVDIEIGTIAGGLVGQGGRSEVPARPRVHDLRDSANARPNCLLSSFSTQRAILPRADSFQFINHHLVHDDLSSTRQQLPTRKHSTQTLGSPDEITSVRDNTTSASSAALSRLPKSKASAFLAPRDRELISGHRLLRPLEPPMPRSQTIGNLSCFTNTGPDVTVSPVKAPRKISEETVGQGQVDVFGALRESRLTQKEVEILRQVEKEARVNNQALRGGRPLAGQYKGSEASNPGKSSGARGSGDSVHLSCNDVANRDRLEARRRLQPASWRDSSIDGACVSDRIVSCPRDAPVTQTNTGVGLGRQPHLTGELAGGVSRSDQRPPPKSVIITEEVDHSLEVGTWLGRYSAIYDQLRTNDAPNVDSNFVQNLSLPCRLKFNTQQTDARLDEAESRRHMDTLYHLRSLCKNADAVCSLEKFERQMRPDRDTAHRTGGSESFPTREQPDDNDRSVPTTSTTRNSKGRSLFPKKIFFLPSSSSSSATSSESQRRSGLPSSQSIWGFGAHNADSGIKPGLVKSETTGSLAAQNDRVSEFMWTDSTLNRGTRGHETTVESTAFRASTLSTTEMWEARVTKQEAAHVIEDCSKRTIRSGEDATQRWNELTALPNPEHFRRQVWDDTAAGIGQAITKDSSESEFDSATENACLKPTDTRHWQEGETQSGRAIIRAGDFLDVPPPNRVLKARALIPEAESVPGTEDSDAWTEQAPRDEPASQVAVERFVPTPLDPDLMGHSDTTRQGAISAEIDAEGTDKEAAPPLPAAYRRADDPPRVSGIPRVEKSIRGRKRSGRQSSGEILKDVAMDIVKGAGKSVRKIARSFTGRSEVEPAAEPGDEGSASIRKLSRDEN